MYIRRNWKAFSWESTNSQVSKNFNIFKQDLKDFAKQNNMVDNDGYIWSISIIRKYNKRFLQNMCYVYDIKYSAYDNKVKLIERLFNDLLF